jgi:hypothetical protein
MPCLYLFEALPRRSTRILAFSMKSLQSLFSCLLIILSLFCFRIYYSDFGPAKRHLNITCWDAFGYYSYLPEIFIYDDLKSWNWAKEIDQKYAVTGGDGLPVQQLENGNKVCKYLGGVALIQSPFFATAHLIAAATNQPADGFSPIYEYCLAFGAILWLGLGIFVLRKTLLRFFSDRVTAITLLALCLGSNLIQYAAIDNGLSHVWIFPLYAFLVEATIRWHNKPKRRSAFLIGWIIGLATICRPTEAVALFIPLFWCMQSREAAKKWALVKMHRPYLLFAFLGGVIGILPQLIYWKIVTGTFVYDVGSKWFFLNPWFRVLVGWEKGWFIYTPITIFFVLGMLFMKGRPFQKSVLAFCAVTIWIVIAWEDWHYGASFSTRALVQSYPVFALPLAALVNRVEEKKWKILFYALCVYLIAVNIFQHVQYISGIIHYDDMNRKYYSHIYLNAHPDALDMSLLDTDEFIDDENGYQHHSFIEKGPIAVKFSAGENVVLADTVLSKNSSSKEQWIKTELQLDAPNSLWKSYLNVELKSADSTIERSIRLYNPVGEKTGAYAFYMRVPEGFSNVELKVMIKSDFAFEGVARKVTVVWLEK